VQVRLAYVERSTGPLVLGPPKSRAGRRIVGIPAAIVPALERHLAVYVKPGPGALVFPGIMGGPIRHGNFNKLSGWPHAVEALGMPGLHFHDYADVSVMPTSARSPCSEAVNARKLSA
jgi:hypothetical protein